MPHVLPFREVIRNSNAPEVLDAFLQLLLGSHLFLVRFPLCSLSFPNPKGSDPKHFRLAAHLSLLQHVDRTLREGAVQRLDVGLPADGAADHSPLRGTGFGLGLGAGGGKVVQRGAALPFTLTFVALAAAVAVRR